MLLVIDVGNTQTQAGVYSGEDLLHEWRISTERGATADELAAHHDQILRLRGGSLGELDEMVVASVVPTLSAAYQSLALKYLRREALLIGPGVRTGISLAIDNPRELGADRLVNAVAAFRRHGRALHRGRLRHRDDLRRRLRGRRVPGRRHRPRHRDLPRRAHEPRGAPRGVDVAPARSIGKSTTESMRSGVVLRHGRDGQRGGRADEGRTRAGTMVLATGGLASLVVPLSVQIDEIHPLLTLEGLRLVHELNVSRLETTGEVR